MRLLQALSGVCEYSILYRKLKVVQGVAIVRSLAPSRQLKLLQYSTPKTDKFILTVDQIHG